MLPPFDAMLFDFDGTLAVLNLDFGAMRRGVLDLAGTYALPVDTLQHLYVLEMIDHGALLLAQQQAGRAAAFHRDAHQIIQDIEVAAAQQGALLPRIEELLATLCRLRIGVGIVTRNCTAAVRRIFPHLETYCQALLTREHVEQVKPHPGHLQAAMARLGSSPARTIMVGDGVLDIQAGKALGMFSVGVLSGETPRDKLLAQGADLILPTAAELLHYLPRLTDTAS
jgi:phosphoglycolate phosphatase